MLWKSDTGSARRLISEASAEEFQKEALVALIDQYCVFGKWKTASALCEGILQALPPGDSALLGALERLSSRLAFAAIALTLDSWSPNNCPSSSLRQITAQMNRVDIELRKREAFGHLYLLERYLLVLGILQNAMMAEKELLTQRSLPGQMRGVLLEFLLVATALEQELLSLLSTLVLKKHPKTSASFESFLRKSLEEGIEHPWEPEYWNFREADRYEILARSISEAEPEELPDLISQIRSEEPILQIEALDETTRILGPLLDNSHAKRATVDLPGVLC